MILLDELLPEVLLGGWVSELYDIFLVLYLFERRVVFSPFYLFPVHFLEKLVLFYLSQTDSTVRVNLQKSQQQVSKLDAHTTNFCVDTVSDDIFLNWKLSLFEHF